MLQLLENKKKKFLALLNETLKAALCDGDKAYKKQYRPACEYVLLLQVHTQWPISKTMLTDVQWEFKQIFLGQ